MTEQLSLFGLFRSVRERGVLIYILIGSEEARMEDRIFAVRVQGSSEKANHTDGFRGIDLQSLYKVSK